MPTNSPPYHQYDLPNQRVDLQHINVVELLDRVLNLSLVCLDIHNEYQRVVLLNLLHRALGVERVDNDFVVVEAGFMGDGFAEVFGCAGELEGLGAVEGRREADFSDLLGVDLYCIILELRDRGRS